VEFGSTRIIVIGGSAGSIAPLRVVLGRIPARFGAAIFVVQHFSSQFRQGIPELVYKDTSLVVRCVADREPIMPGTVYFAPTDDHLVLERGRARLQRSPKDPWNRPAINTLFRSAAAAYGSSVAGVLLSGLLADGAAGLWEIKNAGGIAIVQDPAEAERPAMPRNALENVAVDQCLPAAEIGPLLIKLAGATPMHAWTGSGASARVLIVEDDAAQAIELEHKVRSLGYEVVACVSTGEAALRAARELPDIALVDIRLGGKLDGIETAGILTSRFKIGVIYTTAHDDDETIRRVKSTLPFGYLGKPIRAKDLHGSIEVALSAREMRSHAL
jgi:chemotaxis response regulator CheB